MTVGKRSSSEWNVLLVDGFDLLGSKPQGVSLKDEALQTPSHGLGDKWEASSPTGLRRVTLTQSGAFFDDSAHNIHDTWRPQMQTTVGAQYQPPSRILCLGWDGNVIGQIMAGLQGTCAVDYEVLAQLNKLTMANVAYVVSGQYNEGIILQEYATRTDDWNTAVEGNGVDNGALSSNGGVGYLEVTGFAGPNALTVKIQHAADGGGAGATWVDLVAFTAITGAQTAQRIAVSGTVNRWLRVIASGFGNVSPSVSASASVSPSLSTSMSASASRSPSTSVSPSQSTSLSPSSSRSPSASTSLSPSASRSPSVSASSSASPSLSPSSSTSPSASVSPSAGAGPSSITLFVGFART